MSVAPQLLKYLMRVLSLTNHGLKVATLLEPLSSRFLHTWAAAELPMFSTVALHNRFICNEEHINLVPMQLYSL